MLESCQRIPTRDKAGKMFALVRRPESLWIYAASTPDGNPTNQKRVDAKQNLSVGVAVGFSLNGISRISQPYALGEMIRIRKLPIALTPPDPFFASVFTNWIPQTDDGEIDTIRLYKTWHQEGSTLPYIVDKPEKTRDSMKTQLRYKTIVRPTGWVNTYIGTLNKIQYEAFYLTLSRANSSNSDGATAIFDNSWTKNPAVYSANGGYIFRTQSQQVVPKMNLCGLLYEDINAGQKARLVSNECIPLVVTTPYSFPLPSVRQMGTIIYNPTYSPIAR
jgi:hypothetical protein